MGVDRHHGPVHRARARRRAVVGQHHVAGVHPSGRGLENSAGTVCHPMHGGAFEELDTGGNRAFGDTEAQQVGVHRRHLRIADPREIAIGADDVGQLVGTDCYLAGIRYSQVATVDPYLLCLGVAERAVAAGVQLFERTPVHRVANGPGTVLQSPAGRVHARHVVLANDGSPTGARPVDRSVVPIDTHVVRTAPLPPALLESLGWRSRAAVIDSRTFFHYYRLTHDDRIVFGGGPVAYRGGKRDRDASAQRVYRRLERELVEVFPALAGLPVTDRWYGTTGSTLDRMPVVGQVSGERDVWFSGAWCGHGLALSTASGARIAGTLDPTASAAAARATQLAWQRGRGPWLPGGPLRSWGLGAYVLGLDGVDRAGLFAERALRRRRR